jgi:3-hydroxyisobutyrate dehydrogenase
MNTTEAPHSTFSHIALLGLGAMGTPMARHVTGISEAMTLVDPIPGRANALARELGVTGSETPAAALGADLVILMLPDSAAVDVALYQSGLLDGLAPNSTILDMGSSDPARTVALAAEAATRGLGYVDAPVSGGVRGAEAATLAIMVGGADPDVARVWPVLETLGGSITHVGAAGAGHAMKALNNALSSVGLLAACEVLAIGRRFGLDPTVMLSVLNQSTGRNHATETKLARFILSRDFDSGFAMRLMVKDLTTAMSLPGATDGSLIARSQQEWSAALRDLGESVDHTEVARHVEASLGVELE